MGGDPVNSVDPTGLDIVINGHRNCADRGDCPPPPGVPSDIRQDPLGVTPSQPEAPVGDGDGVPDIVVTATKNQKKPGPKAPPPGASAPPNAKKPFPAREEDTTYTQAACVMLGNFVGQTELETDMACGTDFSGNNPNDPINASPERRRETAKEVAKDMAERMGEMARDTLDIH